MTNENPTALIGFAPLMRMAMSGMDAGPLSQQLLARAAADPDDANALLDMSTLLQIIGKRDLALAMQMQALEIRQLYHLPASAGNADAGAELRLLAIFAPGDLMTNTPLECLLEDADVTLDILYISPELPMTEALPEHDVLFVAIGESDRNHALLASIDEIIQDWPRPVLNLPQRIMHTSRDGAHTLLHGAPGVTMPVTVRLSRAALNQMARGKLSLDLVPGETDFPLIIRPIDSHAGHGLEKLDEPASIADYLSRMPQDEYYVSPFVDYRHADGLFRKYRIALIDGRPYACHMGVSDHWMIHYMNAGMADSADKRAEEENFMVRFDKDFAQRHAVALQAIAERMGLDYLIIDCAEAPDGRLLVFEVDTGAVVHAMDPVDIFPYKQPQMLKVFAAFRAMLGKAAQRF